MVAGSFHVNLPGITSIRVCDEDRVADTGSVPGYPASVGGPDDFHRACDEGMRRAAHDGSQPALIWSGAIALNKPDVRRYYRKKPTFESELAPDPGIRPL